MRSVVGITLFGVFASACLPADSRPTPASVFVAAEAAESTRSGFATTDGWTIRFDRFMTSLGGVDLDGDPDGSETSCNAYSEARYEWLFDFVVAGREKVGLVYGLGICSVEFRLRAPSDDALLGAGATQSDLTFMRMAATDDFVEEGRISLFVDGSATRGSESKRLTWAFRLGFELDRCAAPSGDGYTTVLPLEGEQAVDLTIVVSGDELFRVSPTDAAPVQFDLFASADADGDGSITLAELGEVDAPPQEPWLAADEELFGEEEPPETLADLVYLHNLPRVARVGGGACRPERRD